ncbi:AAA family ATPase [Pedobacter agri]|uniref:AAA family ATPase n=1 Tax=Pedobacter agri TaxID=454586 RepID=A0A9X3IB00_9SPHI|nr:AAA family ATPase [Pedobacter agri]MCX3266564.1 AAA family ATPase [Pedobacter agri]
MISKLKSIFFIIGDSKKYVMRILYVNNFRGFQETIIPLNKVNFLVGENSSGKTSILKLLKVISGEEFRYSLDFSSSVVDLGRFDDIVNKTDSSGKFFEIGMMMNANESFRMLSSENENDNKNLYFIKFLFKEIDEKIKLSELRVRNRTYESLIIYKDSVYQYVYKEIDEASSESETPNNYTSDFYTWCTNPSTLSNRKRFSKTEDQHHYRSSYTRFVFMSIFYEISKKIKTKRKSNDQNYNGYDDFIYIMDSMLPPLKWIAPIRAEPKRIYEHMETKDSIDGSHAPQVLRDILLGTNKKTLQKFKHFIDKFGANSHLYDEIRVKKFGSEKFAPFEIQVILEGKAYAISSVGYGVSQVLPLLLEVFDEKNTWLAIQQPEVHLHPRAQAEFGELLFNSANETDKTFFVETHSDFTLDRFRFCLSEQKDVKFETQVLFFKRTDNKNTVEVIPIDSTGAYFNSSNDTSFRDFFINESIKLLGI